MFLSKWTLRRDGKRTAKNILKDSGQFPMLNERGRVKNHLGKWVLGC